MNTLNRSSLIIEAKCKIIEIKRKEPSIKIDCWSVYKDGTASINHKFVIDVLNDVLNLKNNNYFDADEIEVDPYKDGENLVRLKFGKININK